MFDIKQTLTKNIKLSQIIQFVIIRTIDFI